MPGYNRMRPGKSRGYAYTGKKMKHSAHGATSAHSSHNSSGSMSGGY